MRSQLVHQGGPKESNLDLLEIANETARFLGDLLYEAIVRRTGRTSERPKRFLSIAGTAMPGASGAVVPSTAYLPPRRP